MVVSASSLCGTVGQKAAFLDRDGVINVERNYVHRIEDFQFVSGALAGLRALQSAGYQLFVVTNQAGIAKGYFTEHHFLEFSARVGALLESEGIHITKTYYCPHHPEGSIARYSIACRCRKPAPGMLLAARDEYGLDISNSILIGDKITDIEAARAAGVGRAVFVLTGHAVPQEHRTLADNCLDSVYAVAKWLEQEDL